MSIQNIGRNRWRVVVKAGSDLTTGKGRYIDRIIHGDKQDAAAFETQVRGIGGAAPASLTLGEFLRNHWIPSLTVQASTKEWYEYGLRYINPIVDVRLSKISAHNVESTIHALPPGNPRRHARKTLSAALNAAVRWDILPYNPLAKAQIKMSNDLKRQWLAYSAEELQAVLDMLKDDDAEPVAIIMAFCGLRKEEALALNWTDISLDVGTIKVYKAWAMNGTIPVLKSTKTAGSVREVYMRGWGLERLRELGQEVHGVLWPGKKFDRIMPQAATRHYKRLCERAGVRYIPLNGLRHTHATLSLSSGIDVALVSKSLGHARISTTVNAYIRPLEEARKQAAGDFAQVIGGI
ncbi:MAG: site-specific integrase [Coriobacteriales bacterium]|nr:site-specific integrase [Coriobacteriales bacterium]